MMDTVLLAIIVRMKITNRIYCATNNFMMTQIQSHTTISYPELKYEIFDHKPGK